MVQKESVTRSTDKVTRKKKKKMGRPEGALRDIIPDYQQEYMYQVWGIEQNMEHVSRVCGIHSHTVRKYKEKNQWEQRRAAELEGMTAEIQAKDEAQEKGLEFARKQAIAQLRIVRGKALEAIMALTFKKPADAWKAFKESLEKELELRGHVEPKHISLIMIAAERFQERAKQDPKDVTASAEVTEVKEGPE